MHEFNEFLMKPDKEGRIFLISTDFQSPKVHPTGENRHGSAAFGDYLGKIKVHPDVLVLFSEETRFG